MTFFDEPFGKFRLKLDGGMIGGDSNAHGAAIVAWTGILHPLRKPFRPAV
jgi:hypothetical protein